MLLYKIYRDSIILQIYKIILQNLLQYVMFNRLNKNVNVRNEFIMFINPGLIFFFFLIF